MKFLKFLLVNQFSIFCHSVSLYREVIGGTEARPHSAPYIVSVQILTSDEKKPVHICGGTILNANWILTSAHCLPSKDIVSRLRAHAGCHDILDTGENVQIRKVDYYVQHELYTGGVSPYDIALIYTDEPFKWTKTVQPVALPPSNSKPKGTATLYGWGSTSTTLIPYFPRTLQVADVPIIDYEVCERVLGGPNKSPLHKTNLCTGPLTGGCSVCTSDSGGPLVQKNDKNVDQIVGVVSWGKFPCGQPNSPSVYVQVSLFRDWITKKIKEFEERKSSI